MADGHKNKHILCMVAKNIKTHAISIVMAKLNDQNSKIHHPSDPHAVGVRRSWFDINKELFYTAKCLG